MADDMEISCPVCGEDMDYKLRKSAWYGECKKCRTRVYTHPADMERVLAAQDKEADNGRKTKATA